MSEEEHYYCGRPRCGKIVNLDNPFKVYIYWHEGNDRIVDTICDDCLKELTVRRGGKA